MKSKKSLVIGAVVLLILVGVFALVYTQFVKKPVQGEKEIELEVVLADGSSKTHQMKTNQEYLGDALDEAGFVQGQEGDFGLFIQTVDGVTAEDTNQEWWCLTKGGEQVNTSVDQTPIRNGEHYELTLTVGW